jgi:copper chaperone NosL
MLCAASLAAVPLLGALQGCTAGAPRAIAIGRDQCANCRMVVSDPRYATELVTAKGRTLAFDSIECLATFVLRNDASPAVDRLAIGSLWVAAHPAPNALMPAEQGWFQREEGPGSPMGKGLTAFATEGEARAHGYARTSSLGWDEVLALVEREGLRRGDAHAARS